MKIKTAFLQILLPPLLALASQAATSDAGDWPMFRHDSKMTGHSPIKGDINGEPEILATYDLAGVESVFMIHAGDTSSSATQLREVKEIAGPVTGWDPPSKTIDLYGDGNLVPPPAPPKSKMGTAPQLVEKILKDAKGYQELIWKDFYSEKPTGFMEMRNYIKGRPEPELVWQSSPPEADVYETLMLPVDVNGDGQQDIAMATHNRVAVWNGANGKKIMEARPPVARNYGVFGHANIDDDPYPEFYTVVDFQSHFDMFDNDGKNLSVLWREDVENPNILRVRKIITAGPHPIGDVNGDGRKELVFNYYDRTGDNAWHVMGYDARTGRIIIDLPNAYMDGMADLDGDGHEELFCKATRGLKNRAPGELRLYRLDGNGSMRSIWTHPHALWVTYNEPARADTITMATDGHKNVLTKPFGHEKRPCFYTIQPATGQISRLEGFCIDADESVHPALSAEFHDAADLTVTGCADVDGDGVMELRVRCLSHAPIDEVACSDRIQKISSGRAGGMTDPPIIVRRPKEESLIAIPALTHDYVGLSFDGNEFKELWRREGWGISGRPSHAGLLSADLQGKGEPSIIAAGKSQDWAVTVQTCDLNGKTEWIKEFKDFDGDPPVWNTGGLTHIVSGHYTDPRRSDLLISLRRSMMHSDEGHMLDGRSGDEQWKADAVHCASTITSSGTTLYGFLGDFTLAMDINNDRLDEIIGIYPCDFYVFSGRDGIQQSEANLYGWAPYGQSTGVSLKNGDNNVLCSSPNSLSMLDGDGKVLWKIGGDGKFGSDSSCCLADMDGDGVLEIAGPGFPDGFRVVGAKSGKFLHTLPFESKGPLIPIAADLDGDGRDEVLCANEKKLYCIGLRDKQLAVQWTKEFPQAIHYPVVGIVAGKKVMILISCDDGQLYALGSAKDKKVE